MREKIRYMILCLRIKINTELWKEISKQQLTPKERIREKIKEIIENFKDALIDPRVYCSKCN